MKSFKTIAALVMAVAMLLSSVSAFACANDTFIAYEVYPNAKGEYGKLYKCPELKGGLVRGDDVAEKVEWKLAFYEEEYPHRAVETLVLDGQETGRLEYNGEVAKVATKEVAEFWEAKDPYFIYNRLYSDITGKFEPTTVLTTDYVRATVERDWEDVGFDKYVVRDGKTYDYSKVYAENAGKVDFAYGNLEALKDAYYAAVLNDYDAFVEGKATAAYDIFKDAIKDVNWLKLTGPDYANGGEQTFYPIDKIANGANADWYDNTLVAEDKDAKEVQDDIIDYLRLNYPEEYERDPYAKVEWVKVGYELKAPYRIYEVLSINGVLMDGSEVEVVNEEVRKEEIVEVKEEYADEFHMVEKPVEVVDTTVTTSYDYVIKPYDTAAVKHVDEVVDLKVIENPLLEKVEKIGLAQGPQYEVRFVKVSTEPGKSRLPYIWRYTGGYAEPKVEWKVAFAEAAVPYEIYEEKFVDGKRVYEYRSTGEYANDVPSMNTQLGYRVLTVELQGEVDETAIKMALKDCPYYYYIAGQYVEILVPFEEDLNNVELPEEFFELLGTIPTIETKFVD